MNRLLMLLDCGESFKNAKTLKQHRRRGNVSHCVLKAAEDLITKNKWKTCMFCGMKGTAKRDKDGEMKFFEFTCPAATAQHALNYDCKWQRKQIEDSNPQAIMNKTYKDFQERDFKDPDSYADEYLAATREVVQALTHEKQVFKYTLMRKEAFLHLNVDHYKKGHKAGASWADYGSNVAARSSTGKTNYQITRDYTGSHSVKELDPTPPLGRMSGTR